MSSTQGRPRNAQVDRALFETAQDIIARAGYPGLTVESLVRQAHTSRPAFYRRFRNLPDFLLVLFASRFGLDPGTDHGGLHADLLAVQQHQIEMFNDPMLQHAVAGVLNDLGSDGAFAEQFSDRFLRPRRASVAGILDRAVARGEIPAGADPEWICDLITGPLLMRALLPGLGPIDERLRDQTVANALLELSSGRHPTAAPKAWEAQSPASSSGTA